MKEGKKNRQGRENRQHPTAGEEGTEGELGQTKKPKSKTAGKNSRREIAKGKQSHTMNVFVLSLPREATQFCLLTGLT